MTFRKIKFDTVRNLIYFFLKHLPIKNNRILFTAFKGTQYSCSPKTISEYLEVNGKMNYELIWVSKGIKNIPKNIKCVDYMSLKYIYYYFTSKWIITNNGFKTDFKKPKGQYRLETWHGGGAYKRVNHKITEFGKYKYTVVGNDVDYHISSCTRFSDVMSREIYIYRGKFLEIGMPRNDIFFDADKIAVVKKKVMSKLGVNDCKVVLYAPTWRDNGSTQEVSEICKALKVISDKTKENYVLLCRAHHKGGIKGLQEGIYDVTDYPDMQELLCAADILITDYSSCMWDYSLMYKPCFIYATDIEYYKQERDFYTPMSEWPFPIAKNSNELVNNIVYFDNEKYIKDVKKHHNSLGICEDGHACEKICKIIEEKCCEGA